MSALLTIESWLAATYAAGAPSVHTVRRWIRDGYIDPPPEKHGRSYFLKPEAKLRTVTVEPPSQRSSAARRPPRPRRDVELPATVTLLSADEILGQRIHAPSQPGIYFLIRRDVVVYVGQSTSPICRLGQHAFSIDFDSFMVLPCPRKHLVALEAAYIRMFKPIHNKAQAE